MSFASDQARAQRKAVREAKGVIRRARESAKAKATAHATGSKTAKATTQRTLASDRARRAAQRKKNRGAYGGHPHATPPHARTGVYPYSSEGRPAPAFKDPSFQQLGKAGQFQGPTKASRPRGGARRTPTGNWSFIRSPLRQREIE